MRSGHVWGFEDGPVRDLSVDVVITLYGIAAVLIYMMLIGDFMSDIASCLIAGESDDMGTESHISQARSPVFDLDEALAGSVVFSVSNTWHRSERFQRSYCIRFHNMFNLTGAREDDVDDIE